MKAPYWFALILVLFLGLMFLLEYHLPKKFVWNPTFSQHDHQPFGCAIFDDVLSASCPAGYSLTNQTFYQLNLSLPSAPRPSLLAIAQQMKLVGADRDALLQLASAGSRVMLVSSSFDRGLCDTLRFNHTYNWSRPKDIKKYAASLQPRDSFFYVGSPATPAVADTFTCYPQICNVYFLPKDSSFVPLATVQIDSMQMRSDSLLSCFPAVAMRRSVGKGEIILVSTPLLFTNYGMLDGRNADYLFLILSQLGTAPIIRTEAYGMGMKQQDSALRYFLSQPTLRWALYLTVGVILLFMLTNARRRQRAIPVVCPPQNLSLEFVALIGTLYYQQHQSLDLLRKRFTYFAETLRRTVQIDIEETVDDDLIARRIAAKTGMEETEVRRLLYGLRPLVGEEGQHRHITEQEMKQYIDRMDRISQRCQ